MLIDNSDIPGPMCTGFIERLTTKLEKYNNEYNKNLKN